MSNKESDGIAYIGIVFLVIFMWTVDLIVEYFYAILAVAKQILGFATSISIIAIFIYIAFKFYKWKMENQILQKKWHIKVFLVLLALIVLSFINPYYSITRTIINVVIDKKNLIIFNASEAGKIEAKLETSIETKDNLLEKKKELENTEYKINKKVNLATKKVRQLKDKHGVTELESALKIREIERKLDLIRFNVAHVEKIQEIHSAVTGGISELDNIIGKSQTQLAVAKVFDKKDFQKLSNEIDLVIKKYKDKSGEINKDDLRLPDMKKIWGDI